MEISYNEDRMIVAPIRLYV